MIFSLNYDNPLFVYIQFCKCRNDKLNYRQSGLYNLDGFLILLFLVFYSLVLVSCKNSLVCLFFFFRGKNGDKLHVLQKSPLKEMLCWIVFSIHLKLL